MARWALATGAAIWLIACAPSDQHDWGDTGDGVGGVTLNPAPERPMTDGETRSTGTTAHGGGAHDAVLSL